MRDIFPSERDRTVPPHKPTFDVINLLQDAEKIKRVLSKPIIDLKSLPALGGWTHGSLESLKEQVVFFIRQINNNDEIILENTSKKEDLLIYLTEIASRIEAMKVFLASLGPSSKNDKAIIKAGQMKELKADIVPHEVWATIFSHLSYQDKINMRSTCKDLRRGPLSDTAISIYRLAQEGFYLNNTFKISDLEEAYSLASDKATYKVPVIDKFIFFDVDEFRRTFRLYLNNLAPSIPAKASTMRLAT